MSTDRQQNGANRAPAGPGKPKRTPKAPRENERLLAPEERVKGCEEVNLGFTPEQAQKEALRCLNCVDPKCVQACPLHINIKGFIAHLVESDFAAALETIFDSSPFPGICGRVCQHERFCEDACLLGTKLQPVAIGSLERFTSEWDGQRRALADLPQGPRVALVGSGPASLIAAHDLAVKGYRVTVFEALHELGGVLRYGIPAFRLPREVIRKEIERLGAEGVEFRTDFLVGKTCTLEELFAQGYAAVFLGTGAGLPYMMGVPGENLIGVYTANEFLTRLNLMEAYRFPESDTPVRVGARTVVVGGGNSAMDAARWARRMGSDTTILFRRGREQMRARLEEIAHAEEEGIKLEFLAAPVRLEGNDRGVVERMQCIRMRLDAVDESGRPAPKPIPGSEFWIPVDTVVAAVGQGPNPTVQRATPTLITKDGKITVDASAATSMDGVFAGGDVVRGGSTVIQAMRDGRAAAEAIDRALKARNGHVSMAAPAEITAAKRFRIVSRRELARDTVSIEVEAPEIARRWKCGQFVVLRPTVASERIPLTLVAGDAGRGTIRLIFQVIGKTTQALAELGAGDCLADVLGPLGCAATVGNFGVALCIGGGVGIAELLPVARALRAANNYVVALLGARSQDRMILAEEIAQAADEVHWATDDGSFGFHGTVVDLMRHWRAGFARTPGFAHAIGPIPLMRAAAELTREWNVRTVASLNPIMVDGTGMCGGCRVSVDGKPVFACVDGPEFDAHKVDFEQLALRNRAYVSEEKLARERHECLVGLGR
ncbi:MAG TPA: NADPH-dependent glutamate synthase [Bryobacteraceae bacterium]|nr:NADPH-dependent glutamate synthase [Bryobacteraceae bacterium]